VEDNADSEVQEVTETKNERDITARQETMMFEREQETNKTPESDKTESTPDIFRSPVQDLEEQHVLGDKEAVTTDVVLEERIQATFTSLTYKGNSY
jgi:hypothetical protein